MEKKIPEELLKKNKITRKWNLEPKDLQINKTKSARSTNAIHTRNQLLYGQRYKAKKSCRYPRRIGLRIENHQHEAKI